MNGSGSISGSVSGVLISRFSDLGDCSRSETYRKAGRAARMAGVIILGSDGRFLATDVAEFTDDF